MTITNYESKEEADAHMEDMGGFVDFMNEICKVCKKKHQDCKCKREFV